MTGSLTRQFGHNGAPPASRAAGSRTLPQREHGTARSRAKQFRLHDTTVRRHWEAARKVNAKGEAVTIVHITHRTQRVADNTNDANLQVNSLPGSAAQDNPAAGRPPVGSSTAGYTKVGSDYLQAALARALQPAWAAGASTGQQ